MTQPQKNTALLAAIVMGVLSIPMTWMTVPASQMQGGFGDVMNSFGPMSLDITGLNGHVTFIIKTPLWFPVGMAVAASILQLMSPSDSFAIPTALERILAVFALSWISLAIVLVVFSAKATLGIGALLGLASAVISVVCLKVIPENTATSGSKDRSADDSATV